MFCILNCARRVYVMFVVCAHFAYTVCPKIENAVCEIFVLDEENVKVNCSVQVSILTIFQQCLGIAYNVYFDNVHHCA